MNDLHKNQILLLEILERNIENPLTIRDIQNFLGFSSTSVVVHHIQQLEKKGYLKRNQNNKKDYQVFRNPDNPIVYLNLYGNAQCGPNGSLLDGNPIDNIPIASRLLKFPAIEGFIVSAKGNSMQPNIAEGDLVIAQKSKIANNGDTIICVLGEEVLIKKFFRQNKYITLISTNSERYSPIIVNDYFQVVGIVRNIIKYS